MTVLIPDTGIVYPHYRVVWIGKWGWEWGVGRYESRDEALRHCRDAGLLGVVRVEPWEHGISPFGAPASDAWRNRDLDLAIGMATGATLDRSVHLPGVSAKAMDEADRWLRLVGGDRLVQIFVEHENPEAIRKE